MDVPDIDPNFEPQTRARSNTWPLRPKEVTSDQQSTSPAPDDTNGDGAPQKESISLNCKKTSSRRNAWGNLSYADLITKAIQSSPDQRLTLSQIYDWMVQNVPYFRDKGDSNSSAGWKNSIRHNLSLHNRFMRIQNEGTGKSSWWVINPDAKPGKPARRRTSSMDTKSLVTKRDRVRKRVRELKSQRLEGGNSHISDDNFITLSPSDPNSQFRERVDSAHSTHSGRLSPIPAVPGFEFEKELDDDLPWDGGNYVPSGDVYSDTTLVDSLIDSMKIVDNSNGLQMVVQDNLSPSPQMYNQNNNYSPQYNDLPAPPPYPDHQNRSPRQQSPSLLSDLNQKNAFDGISIDMPQPQQNLDFCPASMVHEPLPMSLNSQGQQTSPNPSPQVMNYLQTSSPYGPQAQQLSPKPRQMSPQPRSPQLSPQPSPHRPQATRTNPLLQQHLQSSNNSLLLKALTRNQAHTQAQQLDLLRSLNQARAEGKVPLFNPQVASSGQMNPLPVVTNNSSVNSQLLNQLTQSAPSVNQLRGQFGFANGQSVGETGHFLIEDPMENTSPNTFSNLSTSATLHTTGTGGSGTNLENLNDIDLDSLIGVDCDVEQVINQELNLDGNLDFNFEQILSDTTNNENMVH